MECYPDGRNAPQATVCFKERIRSYPTWFIKGTRYEGVIEIDRLALLSDYTGKGKERN